TCIRRPTRPRTNPLTKQEKQQKGLVVNALPWVTSNNAQPSPKGREPCSHMYVYIHIHRQITGT
ncbi:hypothetical protein LIPSTDRAFT_71046, partial [Lipomyces starkeyi NRRL Y-11557]